MDSYCDNCANKGRGCVPRTSLHSAAVLLCLGAAPAQMMEIGQGVYLFCFSDISTQILQQAKDIKYGRSAIEPGRLDMAMGVLRRSAAALGRALDQLRSRVITVKSHPHVWRTSPASRVRAAATRKRPSAA